MAMNSTVQEQLENWMKLEVVGALVLLMPTSVVFKHSETAVKRLNSLPFLTVSLETGPNPSSSTADVVQLADLEVVSKLLS